MICRVIRYSTVNLENHLIENKLIVGFQRKVQFQYKDHRVRLLNRLEENRIEVLIQSLLKEVNTNEGSLFREIYDFIKEEIELLLRECYPRLLVNTFIHPPDNSASGFSVASSSPKMLGLISLHKIQLLLRPCDMYADLNPNSLPSEDGNFHVKLVPRELKQSSYWSVWKEKVRVCLDETLPVSEPYSLSEEKTTHVFLSHDWGIDGTNHEFVKQVGEALKKKGLKVWIDDDSDELGNRRITTHLDDAISKAIEKTECMLAFITENYINKVNGEDVTDYCKKELSFGLDELKKRVIPIIVDSKVTLPLKGTIKFKFPDALYHNMSALFDSTTVSNEKTSDHIEELFKLILNVIASPLRRDQSSKKTQNDDVNALTCLGSSSCNTLMFGLCLVSLLLLSLLLFLLCLFHFL